ncbi:invasion associated locus B family protein [Methylocapsa sp. S129]|uniref:invasion associated locus B family protein n=1 Tax=Methylocapsa sp. S129 TaxID=1641869 RepID=UPI00131E3515|nr:invasion associated locus B family protein [Methylocapsa sp. S129]
MARSFWVAVAALGMALAVQPAASQTTPKPDAAKPAPGPVSADPQSTTAAYGDWVVRCQRIGDGAAAQRVCEAAETIQTQGAQGPIAQIAIGRVAPTDPLRLTLVLPPNVSFPSAPRMEVDDKDAHPVDLNWRRCLSGGCFADAEMKDDLLQFWRRQAGQGSIKFRDGVGRDIAAPFSFRGLAQALDALAKS